LFTNSKFVEIAITNIHSHLSWTVRKHLITESEIEQIALEILGKDLAISICHWPND
jgi:hypothetical protein